MQIVQRPAVLRSVASDVSARLEELGRTPLVAFDYRAMPGPTPKRPMQRIATAFPTWNDQAISDAADLGWDGFWKARPAGAGRIAATGAASFDDAVRAARQLALTTRPGMADGDKQAQAVLQLSDGSFRLASLGGVEAATQSAWLLRMGTYEGYWRPKATALVPELVAVVGGASMVDLRGAAGRPVQT